MTRVCRGSLVALVLIAAACARTHSAMSIDLRNAPGVASGQAGHSAIGADGALGASRTTPGSAGRGFTARDGGIAEPVASSVKPASGRMDSAPVAADAAANRGTEVWIGQLWSVAPALCDPDAPWSDTPVVVQPMGYIDRAVLVLEHSGNTELQGRIQLGEGALPTSPGNAPYADPSGSYWICSIQMPTKGVEYTLLEPVLTSDRLMFQISASEVWNTWCQTQSSPCPGGPSGTCPPTSPLSTGPVCACKDSACTAAEHARVAFDLAITKDTIEGELPLGGVFGTPAQLRLRRAQ